MPPLSERAQSEKNCANCAKSARQATLRNCTGCSLTPYCSKECQKLNWKAHKPRCMEFRVVNQRIKDAEANGVMVNGISPIKVDSKFRKWIVAVQPLIDRYTIAAMDFTRYPDRCFTHVVVLTVQCNLDPANTKALTPSEHIKQFLIEDAVMYELEEIPTIHEFTVRREVDNFLPFARKMREDGTGFGIAFAAIYFPALSVTQVTTLVLRKRFDPSTEPVIGNWAAELKEHIRNGIVI